MRSWTHETPSSSLDNDGDGQADCDDGDCQDDPVCVQPCGSTQPIACGQQVSGNTTGGTSAKDGHGCADRVDADAPELVFEFTPTEVVPTSAPEEATRSR